MNSADSPNTVIVNKDRPINDEKRRSWLEDVEGDLVVGEVAQSAFVHVPVHRHTRGQLLHVSSGVVLVKTGFGHWMVPTGQAIWIPPGIEHAVEMMTDVRMQSVYVLPEAISGLPARPRVVGITALMRSLLEEVAPLPHVAQPTGRNGLLYKLIMHEIPRLPELPLGLPFPADPRLARMCRSFLEAPESRVTIDQWARAAGMSRRTFTRRFKQEAGVSLSLWRQQASLFAALPRLASGEAVTTVALDLGYDSVAAFTTMFKRMLGASPRNYLRIPDPGEVN
ncbi:helix-turn-helix transcriptional regulator [uncultured Nitratireductor sp.]|uniref:AraC family transcriptional regulator n=1 Tax=uncultured Nitratireductor sp. TaxID=520953 RepID=UPI0025E24CD6|nr:helix-turn-helix transcriptional regulator [uncultured Nitratireductor sp.]